MNIIFISFNTPQTMEIQELLWPGDTLAVVGDGPI